MTLLFRTESRVADRLLVTRALKLSRADWGDVIVAIAELARARIALARTTPKQLLSQGQVASGRGSPAIVERVARAIARASHRVPWRADCLVQAIAAQRWLNRHGVHPQLVIGVPEERGSDFEAHAWLVHDGRIVTGGDVGAYVPIVGRPDRRHSEAA